MTPCHQAVQRQSAHHDIQCSPVPRPSLEVGHLFQQYGDRYLAGHRVSPMQAKVMRRLAACRTATLGGHVDACQDVIRSASVTTHVVIVLTAQNATPQSKPLGWRVGSIAYCRCRIFTLFSPCRSNSIR